MPCGKKKFELRDYKNEVADLVVTLLGCLIFFFSSSIT